MLVFKYRPSPFLVELLLSSPAASTVTVSPAPVPLLSSGASEGPVVRLWMGSHPNKNIERTG